jgi:hypothetical protein
VTGSAPLRVAIVGGGRWIYDYDVEAEAAPLAAALGAWTADLAPSGYGAGRVPIQP